MENLDL